MELDQELEVSYWKSRHWSLEEKRRWLRQYFCLGLNFNGVVLHQVTTLLIRTATEIECERTTNRINGHFYPDDQEWQTQFEWDIERYPDNKEWHFYLLKGAWRCEAEELARSMQKVYDTFSFWVDEPSPNCFLVRALREPILSN